MHFTHAGGRNLLLPQHGNALGDLVVQLLCGGECEIGHLRGMQLMIRRRLPVCAAKPRQPRQDRDAFLIDLSVLHAPRCIRDGLDDRAIDAKRDVRVRVLVEVTVIHEKPGQIVVGLR